MIVNLDSLLPKTSEACFGLRLTTFMFIAAPYGMLA
jgi:hypothetical protein